MQTYRAPDDRPFTASEALAAGLTANDIRHAVDSGVWVRLRKRVFATARFVALATRDPRSAHALQVHALILAMSRRNIAAAGLSAARILGLDLLPEAPTQLVVCTDDPGVSGTRRNDYFLRWAPLPAHEVHWRCGIPVTTPQRTLLDLAANLDFAPALVAADSAYRLKLIKPGDLDAILDDRYKRPGIQAAREVFAFAQPGSESALESYSRATMRDLGIPMPTIQVVVRDDIRPNIRVDFDWAPDLDLVGEADGMNKYLPADGADRMATIRAIRDEKARERNILEVRREIVRWGWREARDPVLLGALLRPAIARAMERRDCSA